MNKGLAKQQGLTLPSIPTLSLEHLDYMDRLDFGSAEQLVLFEVSR